MKQNECQYVVIYDLETNLIEIDYSLGKNCTYIRQFKNYILVYGQQISDTFINEKFPYINYIDNYECKIWSLKPNIQKIKTHDLYFYFE